MSIITECPHCKSKNLIRQVGDDEPSIHYGRLTCGDCTRFIKWLPKPENAFAKFKYALKSKSPTVEAARDIVDC